jgi:hypothetical protein
MSSRWIRFFLVILVGIAGGLAYGWVLNPVKYVDTTPDTLRVDYKSDYVLMVAEVYRANSDIAQAEKRLALLGETPPGEMVLQAILFGEQNHYSDADLALMRALADALEAQAPSLETPRP